MDPMQRHAEAQKLAAFIKAALDRITRDFDGSRHGGQPAQGDDGSKA